MALSTQDKAAALAGVPLFAGISAESMERLAAVAGEQEFAAGQFIVRQGQVGTGLYVILGGTVKVLRGSDVVARLGRGEFFGELSVIDQQPRNASVEAAPPPSNAPPRPPPRPPACGVSPMSNVSSFPARVRRTIR